MPLPSATTCALVTVPAVPMMPALATETGVEMIAVSALANMETLSLILPTEILITMVLFQLLTMQSSPNGPSQEPGSSTPILRQMRHICTLSAPTKVFVTEALESAFASMDMREAPAREPSAPTSAPEMESAEMSLIYNKFFLTASHRPINFGMV